eukprot:scaffold44422_cov57-Phaeocystis_antarctica.AAC.3
MWPPESVARIGNFACVAEESRAGARDAGVVHQARHYDLEQDDLHCGAIKSGKQRAKGCLGQNALRNQRSA